MDSLQMMSSRRVILLFFEKKEKLYFIIDCQELCLKTSEKNLRFSVQLHKSAFIESFAVFDGFMATSSTHHHFHNKMYGNSIVNYSWTVLGSLKQLSLLYCHPCSFHSELLNTTCISSLPLENTNSYNLEFIIQQ